MFCYRAHPPSTRNLFHRMQLMDLWAPQSASIGGDLDHRLGELAARPAVFSIHLTEGEPYTGRTANLSRRFARLLGPDRSRSRLLNLRSVAARVEWQYTASWLETNLLLWEVSRRYHPKNYRSLMRLRLPPYLKIGLSNPFPRCYVSTRLAGSNGVWYGPFRNHARAEQFEAQLLSLFQIRRCQEDLAPSPDHPGCIYGEMNMCLRPCQQVVGREEYASEVLRLTEFLATGGRSLAEVLTQARDQLSAEMRYEEAARIHRQLEAVERVMKTADELAAEIDRLNGVAVTRSVEAGAVELWFFLNGCWLHPVRFRVADPGCTESLDHRLRAIAAGIAAPRLSAREREEHLALLARWYYSSFRDGEWLRFTALEQLPYRKLVHAISRVARDAAG